MCCRIRQLSREKRKVTLGWSNKLTHVTILQTQYTTFDPTTHTRDCLNVPVLQDLAAELERERTKSVMAQQAANQEKLQARASAAESASLRRQLKELADQLAQEKHAAGAASRSNSGQPDAQLVGCCLNQPNLFKRRRQQPDVPACQQDYKLTRSWC